MLKNGIEVIGTIYDNPDFVIDCNHSDVICQNDYIFINRSKHPMHQIISVDVKGSLGENKVITVNNENFYSISGSKIYTISYRDIHKKTTTVTRTLPLQLLFKLPPQCINVEKARLVIYDLTPQNLNEDIVICNIMLILYLNLELEPMNVETQEIKICNDNVSSINEADDELDAPINLHSMITEKTIPDIEDVENFYMSEKDGVDINSLPNKNILPEEDLSSQTSTIEIDEEFM